MCSSYTTCLGCTGKDSQNCDSGLGQSVSGDCPFNYWSMSQAVDLDDQIFVLLLSWPPAVTIHKLSCSLPVHLEFYLFCLAPSSLTSMPSTRCAGCSKSFQYFPSNTCCGWCIDRAAGRNTAWPQCTGCGSVYEFLDPTSLCSACKEHHESLKSKPPSVQFS